MKRDLSINGSGDDWNTPPELLDRVRALDRRRRIGLDPCSNRHAVVFARTAIARPADGLSVSWRGHGLVFVNMPHSDPAPWIAKGVAEFVARPARGDDQLVVLGPVKADTAWFHDYVRRYDAHVLLRGRVKYLERGTVRGTGRFASMVMYAGEHRARFERAFADLGWVL